MGVMAPQGATHPRSTRRLRLLAHHVHPHDAGASAEPAARMLRSAWSHNSIELSERPAPRGHRVLSDADHDFLATHGWLRVPNAVPPEAIQRAVADTWAYLGERWGMSPEDRESWYNEEHSNGHVKKYQSQGQVGQPARSATPSAHNRPQPAPRPPNLPGAPLPPLC